MQAQTHASRPVLHEDAQMPLEQEFVTIRLYL